MFFGSEEVLFTAAPAGFEPALELIGVLERHGEAWVVGGAVRDALLGVACDDLDMACSLPAAETAALLEDAGYRVIPTGIAHGTVTAVSGGVPVEITSYRMDGTYSDGRHPDEVKPAKTIEEDLSRRDFTVNAMAWHPERGLGDPFGGLKDLEQGIIRCVGDPEARFAEDALRILRALRFASQLGFTIEEHTAEAARQLKGRLDLLARERVAHELERLLVGRDACAVLIAFPDVLAQIIPEIADCVDCPQVTPYHCWGVWEHIAHTVGSAPPEPTLRWAAMLHDIGKPASHVMTDGRSHFKGHAKAGLAIAERVAAELHLPRTQAEAIALLVLHHDDDIPCEARAIRRWVNRMGGPEAFFTLCDLKIADSDAHAPEHRERGEQAKRLKAKLQEMLDAGEPFTVRDLAVNGYDLMALGMYEGPELGRVLRELFDEVSRGKLPNDRRALLARAAELIA